MTNQAIGLALTKIATLLGAFGSALMGRAVDLDNAAVLRTLQDVHSTKTIAASAKADVKKSPVALSDRHKTIIAKFKKAGIKNPQLFTDIKTPALWAADGFRPKKGSKAIHGLFHRSQVQAIA